MVEDGRPARSTRWCVITGAPSSGKTAVVEQLEHLGFRVVHETARALIEDEMKKGRSLQEIKSDPLKFERRILRKKIEIESHLPAGARLFLDRAVPDSIAYFRFEGLDSIEPERESLRVRYHRVFFFDRLRFTDDPVRSESGKSAQRLERLLAACYRELGYDLIRVPVLSVAERTQFVLGHR